MNRSAKRSVLVLGASGFFGGWICRALEASGFQVMPASRSEGGDLLDPKDLRRLIGAERPDAIVNAAGMTSPARALADPAGCFAVNTGGVLNLLEAARLESPDSHLVALSSAAVYKGEPPFDEKSATAAGTPYAASKLAMEILCGQYARGPELPVTTLRCFNLTGPGEPASQATSEFTRAAIEVGPGGRAEVQVGEPSTARDFTDVRDAARAVRLVIEREAGGIFNLCSGEAISLTGLATMIGGLAGVEVNLRGSGSGRPASGLLSIYGEGSKLREATGWEPRIPLEASLGDLLASLRKSG